MVKISKYDRDLDQYDKKILYELDVNARVSATNISKKIRLPKETVNFRIKRMLKKGYIRHFYTIINASCFGYQYYKIFFKFSKLTIKIEKDIIDYLLREKTCANLRITQGLYDICFVTMHRNPLELKEFLYKLNKHFGGYAVQKSIHIIISSHKLNQKFLFAGEAVRKQFYHGEVINYNLDKIDLKVIKLLSTGARLKLIDLAQNIKEDPRVVRYHIKKLERNGIIVGYFTALNIDLFHRAFIQLDISVKNTECIPGIIEFFDHTGACVFASELIGKYDLTAEIYVESDCQLREILAQFKEKFLQKYIFYDVSRIYQEFVVNWSPFDAYKDIKESEGKI